MTVTSAVYTTVRDIVSDVANVAADDLTPLTRFSTLHLSQRQVGQIYLRACQALDVPVSQLVATRPMVEARGDPRTMASLQIIGAFDSNARRLLERLDAYPDDDTVASVAESVVEGAYIASGFRQSGLNAVHGRGAVLACVTICLAICLGALPAAMAAILDDPSVFWAVLPAGLGLSLAIAVWALVPGIGAMLRHRKRGGRRLPL